MAHATSTQDLVSRRLAESQRALAALGSMRESLVELTQVVRDSVEAGRLTMTCGNGGSAAEAMHLAEELIGRYRSNRAPIAAICLNSDPTAITCIANDFGFDEVFARQVDALGSDGALLIVFSTSGRSPNILRALEQARSRGMRSVGLLGGDGGPAASMCDHAIVVRGVDSAAVQEAHQVILHLLCEALEPA
ncbi:MAG: SIS domain-containing protein [Phycisphaerales bacterium]|nr:SIS domain-containing protein [Phycisphaerales bacterium]